MGGVPRNSVLAWASLPLQGTSKGPDDLFSSDGEHWIQGSLADPSPPLFSLSFFPWSRHRL